MEKNNEPEFVAKTLEWCNERRAEQGREPLDRLPKGRKHDPVSCPCGIATGLSVGTTTWAKHPRTDQVYYPLPEEIICFVIAFDNEELPQYDLNPWIEDLPDA